MIVVAWELGIRWDLWNFSGFGDKVGRIGRVRAFRNGSQKSGRVCQWGYYYP